MGLNELLLSDQLKMDDTRGEEVGLPTKSQDICESEMSISRTNTVANMLDRMESLDSFVSTNDPRNYVVVEEALSNFVVLRNIFLMLEDDDLLIIRQVSKCWRTVADLMISTRYDVQLGKRNFEQEEDNPGPLEIDYVVVKKRDRDDRRSFTEFETNFKGAFQILKEDVQSPEITISINVEDDVDIQNGLGRHFFSQFGHLVVDLEFTGQCSLPLNSFCKLLLEDLPNLKELKLSDLWFEDDSLEDQMFSPDLHQHMHSILRKISFRNGTGGTWTFGTLGKFLKMFPNLETIDQMPLLFIEAVVQAQKGHVLKSLNSFDDRVFVDNEETEASAFNKLAQLQPTLTSFHLPPSTYCIETNHGLVLSSVFSILQSSSESLESLIMSATTCYGIVATPKMKGLKSLELNDVNDEFFGVGDVGFFPRDVSLQEIFPNVNDLSLSFVFKLNENWVNRYLPVNVFSPWGSQIKQLKISSISLGVLHLFQRLFPAIEELQLRRCSGKDLAEMLLKLPHLWPELKSLTIPVAWNPFILDWEFLGLSKDDVVQLTDPSRGGNFPDSEIQGFKDRCCICKLKGLKQLTIALPRFFKPVGEIVTRLTSISNQVGFKLLEDLKVTVDVSRCHRYFEAIKKELKLLASASSGNIEILESIY